MGELEHLSGGNASASNSGYEESGACRDNQERATKTKRSGADVEKSNDDNETGNNGPTIDSEDGIQASAVGRSLSYSVSSGVGDNLNGSLCQVKELESVLEEGETIIESEFNSSRKDVEVAVNTDSKIESSAKDLEMG